MSGQSDSIRGWVGKWTRRGIACAALALLVPALAGAQNDPLPEDPFFLQITVGPADGSRIAGPDVVFEFEASPHAVVRCAFDGEALGVCKSPLELSWLEDGPHRFQAVAEGSDAAEYAVDSRSFFVGIGDDGLGPPLRVDSDGDGVPDGSDACPGSGRRGATLARGCAPVEIAARPGLLLEPVRGPFTRARVAFGADGPFGVHGHSVVRGLLAAERLLEQGVELLGNGQICPGAVVAGNAARQLEQQNDAAAMLAGSLGDGLIRSIFETGDFSDADDAEVAYHEMAWRVGLHEQAVQAALDVATITSALCGALDGVEWTEGTVVRTLDERGLVVLDDGQVLAVGGTRPSATVHEGMTIRAKTNKFKDGTGQTTNTQDASASQADVPQVSLPCVFLRVAPFQRFLPPVTPSQVVLHRPVAYEVNGWLELEEGMRIGGVLGSCPTDVVGGPYQGAKYRYSLELWLTLGSGPLQLLASDWTPGDMPVELPVSWITSTRSGILRVKRMVQTCIGVFCSSPTQMSSVDMNLKIHPQGSLAELRYNSTLLYLDDWNPGDGTVAYVSSAILKAPVATGGLPSFEAEGFSASGDGSWTTVSFADPYFMIYTSDPVDPDILYARETFGTDKKAGLMWPRAKGFRNGQEFWYSATLPTIARDTLTECLPLPHAFYRYPWTSGVTRKVGQGNFGTFSHSGSQSYAWDFDFAEGDLIRAARGGVVEWLIESITQNFDPNGPSPTGNLPWGNAVRIRHQDGTTSWYFHIQPNGVMVAVGDDIQRGQPIALSGNTGRSGGPHLHYQVQATSADWGQSIRSLFDGCKIPVKDEDLTSNNSNPNFP